MAIRLHAITLADAHLELPGPGAGNLTQTETYAGNGLGVSLVPFRDLCAVVSDQGGFVLDDASPNEVARHRSIVDAVFQRAPVVPAPIGVVFRGGDVLKRWMELHYVSLSGALEFVEDRVAARVHIARAAVRRAERRMVALAAEAPVNPAALSYVNRLSDLLFVLARALNGGGAGDVLWTPGANR